MRSPVISRVTGFAAAQTRCLTLFLTWVAALAFLLPQPVSAQEGPNATQPAVVSTANGVRITWENTAPARAKAEAPWRDWPQVEVNGLKLPGQLVAVRLQGDSAPLPYIEQLESHPWTGTAVPGEPVAAAIPRRVDGPPRPDLARPLDSTLPDAPLVLLRQGRLRGQLLAVYVLLPVFAQDGRAQEVTRLDATLPGALPLDTDTSAQLDRGALDGRVRPQQVAPAPVNDLAARKAVKLLVSQPGIQRVAWADLAAAGLDVEQIDVDRLQLWHRGQPLALEARADELRFYAPAVHDRWNASDTYWLSLEESPGLRMAQRPASSPTLPAQESGYESGQWHPKTFYDSTLPGTDGDHWFAADLRTGPDQAPMTLTVPIGAVLPTLATTATFTLTGSAYTLGPHKLVVTPNTGMDMAAQTLMWQGTGQWSQAFTAPGNVSAFTFVLTPGSAADGIEIDSLAWTLPVHLDFNGAGGFFQLPAGSQSYQLSGLPRPFTLYDITDPQRPQIVATEGGDSSQTELLIESGPEASRYLLAGPSQQQLYLPVVLSNGSNGSRQTPQAVERSIQTRAATLLHPQVLAHSPTNLAKPLNAAVLYIAPDLFHEPLAPLLAHRRAQGYTVQAIDVQAIYDAWSYGQVSPQAIRNFLRYAAATWDPVPQAVTLVGDGTSDPFNYLGYDNANFIPPYLATVDPWLGETACENCYAQLDGESALADWLPDLMLGRLPVKSPVELEALVAKIIGYEQDDEPGLWRSRAVYVTDNYRNADGSVDGAGNFPATADASAALQPANLEIRRVYYDPASTAEDGYWHEADAVQAYRQTQAYLNQGAGLVNYIGHAHHWQWAVTDLNAVPPYLLGLFDVDALANQTRLPVLLEMTCLTAAFQQPAIGGTTIDERWLLNFNGGAVAVWGPTGLGVAYGHDTLQAGFYSALWADGGAPDVARKPLGELTEAAYLHLFTAGTCCQETLRTYVLLGDPLTEPRVEARQRAWLYLPLVRGLRP